MDTVIGILSVYVILAVAHWVFVPAPYFFRMRVKEHCGKYRVQAASWFCPFIWLTEDSGVTMHWWDPVEYDSYESAMNALKGYYRRRS